MIMKKRIRLIVGIAVALIAAVSIFVLFANGIGDEGGKPSFRGNTFQIMFGELGGRHAIPLLIMAFAFECSAVGLALIAAFMPGIISRAIFFICVALLVTAGIMFFNLRSLYLSVNVVSESGPGLGALGPGPICSGIFAMVAAVVALYGVIRKEN